MPRRAECANVNKPLPPPPLLLEDDDGDEEESQGPHEDFVAVEGTPRKIRAFYPPMHPGEIPHVQLVAGEG